MTRFEAQALPSKEYMLACWHAGAASARDGGYNACDIPFVAVALDPALRRGVRRKIRWPHVRRGWTALTEEHIEQYESAGCLTFAGVSTQPGVLELNHCLVPSWAWHMRGAEARKVASARPKIWFAVRTIRS